MAYSMHTASRSRSWIVGLPGRGPTTLSLQTGSRALNCGPKCHCLLFSLFVSVRNLFLRSEMSLPQHLLLSMVVAIHLQWCLCLHGCAICIGDGCPTQEDAEEGEWCPWSQAFPSPCVVSAKEFGCWLWPGPTATCRPTSQTSSRSCSSCSSTPSACCSTEGYYALRGFWVIGLWCHRGD